MTELSVSAMYLILKEISLDTIHNHKKRLFLANLMVELALVVMHLPFPVPLEFIGYRKIAAAACKKIREELTSFLCHYRNKLIFGFNRREGDMVRQSMSRQAFRQGGKRRPPAVHTLTHTH